MRNKRENWIAENQQISSSKLNRVETGLNDWENGADSKTLLEYFNLLVSVKQSEQFETCLHKYYKMSLNNNQNTISWNSIIEV